MELRLNILVPGCVVLSFAMTGVTEGDSTSSSGDSLFGAVEGPERQYILASAAEEKLGQSSSGGSLNEVLPYNLGGTFSPPRNAVYVDAVNGDDSNPGTIERPFKTGSVDNLSDTKDGRYGPGWHILFKRGQNHTNARFWLDGVSGTAENPVVVGAYGSGQRPKLSPPERSKQKEIVIKKSSHIMIRDLELGGVTMTGGANNITIYNMVFNGHDNGNVVATSDTSHTAIVSSYFKELRSSDHINIHETPTGSGHMRGGWWIIDNEIDGSSNAEDCIDLFDLGVPTEFQDIKVVGNRIKGNESRGPLILNNMGKYVWIVANTVTAGRKFGIHMGQGLFNNVPEAGLFLEYVQLSGNIVWGQPSGGKQVLRAWRLKNSRVIWNTAINSDSNNVDQTGSIDIDPAKQGNGNVVANNLENFDGRPLPYGISIPQPRYPSGQSESRASDLVSQLENFYPVSDNAPGAFDSKGNRRGMTIQEFSGFGTGWKGPPIVQKTLRELGGRME